MVPGGDRDERKNVFGDSESFLSRRRFITGGLLGVGGTSLFLSNNTKARFSDSLSATGKIEIDAEPTLNYQIIENNPNGNPDHVQYDIAFQAEWVEGFQSVDVYFDNDVNGEYDNDASISEEFLDNPDEGTVSTDRYWDVGEDDFEFVFVVNSDNEDGFTKVATDTSGDGDGSKDGEFGNSGDPTLDSFTVYDQTDDPGTRFEIEYSTSNFTTDYHVWAEFEDLDVQDDWPDETDENPNSSDVLTYPPSDVDWDYRGGTSGHTFRITVKIRKNQSEVPVASGQVENTSGDGNNSTYP